MQNRLRSFEYAVEGIIWVLREHPNLRIHLLISIFALLAANFLGFTNQEYVLLLLTILVVVITEMMNTAVEEVTDLITVKWAKQAKVAKDVAAGMVLVSSIGAIVVGVLLFLPKLILVTN